MCVPAHCMCSALVAPACAAGGTCMRCGIMMGGNGSYIHARVIDLINALPNCDSTPAEVWTNMQ